MTFHKHHAMWYVSRAGSLVLVVLIGAGTYLYVWYRRDMQKAEARIARGSLIAETACGPIEYADQLKAVAGANRR